MEEEILGQYYKICNLDKRQFLDPHKAGNGLKLMEFANSMPGIGQLLLVLLADGNNRGGGDLRSDDPIIGSWAGDRIVVAGDYADEGKFLDYLFKDEVDWETAAAEMSKPDEDGDQEEVTVEQLKNMTLYHVARSLFEDVTDKAIDAIIDGEGDDSPYKYMAREEGWRTIPTDEMVEYAKKKGLTSIDSQLYWKLFHNPQMMKEA